MRILVVDDHALVRKGICSVLATNSALTVCGEAVDGQDGVDKARELRPDVVVMDLSMPRLNGLEATREIKRFLPDSKILIVTQHDSPELARLALSAGARGYVSKSSISTDLLAAIAKVHHDESFVQVARPADKAQKPEAPEVFQRSGSAVFEKALRESEERFRAAFSQTYAFMVLISPDGTILDANRAAIEGLGFARQQVVGRKFWEPWSSSLPRETERSKTIIQRVAAGETVREHCEYCLADGTLRLADRTLSPVKDADGRVIVIVATGSDITEQKDVEDRRKQVEQATGLLAAIVESSADAIVSKDLTGTITSWNKGAHRIFGYTPEEAIGKNIRLIIPADHRDEEVTILDRIKRGERIDHFETVRVRKDGSLVDISLAVSPLLDSASRVIGASKVARDITEQKRVERALRENEEQLRLLAASLESQVHIRTRELELRNAEILRQSDQLRNMSNRLLQTQDYERRHIARELHDSAGQTLTVLSMNISSLVRQAQDQAPELAKDAQAIHQLIQQLSQEIRTTSYLLHPPLLDESGLAAALSWYVKGLEERSGISITLDISEEFGRLPRDLELAMFRVVQECLTNIHRHSGSQNAEIFITRDEQKVAITVQDHGKGLSPEELEELRASSRGVGTRGMRERLRLFHGTLNIDSNGSGVKVSATIPISAELSLEPPYAAKPLKAGV